MARRLRVCNPTSTPHPPGPDIQLTILLVDDEANVLASLSRLLAAAGYEVVQALSAETALALLGDGIDLVISDVQMPGMDGVEFLRAARNVGDTTPFILITGYESVSSAVGALRAGAADYLRKPVKTADLMGAIAKVTVGGD